MLEINWNNISNSKDFRNAMREESMRRIIFATGNQEKMKEIRQIMSGVPVEVCSMKEAGIRCEVEENGKTFAQNARLKADGIAKVLKKMYSDAGKEYTDIVLADDSGLEIDALNKEPGVYSARYMGEDTPYHEKNMNLVSLELIYITLFGMISVLGISKWLRLV